MPACVGVYYRLSPPVHTHRTPFENRTCLDHLNTGLVRYSEGYWIWIWIVVKSYLNPSQKTGSRPICCIKLLTVSCPCSLRNCPIHWDATWKRIITSNDYIAGNVSVLKLYMFIMFMMYHIATPTIGYLLIHVVYVYIFVVEETFSEIKPWNKTILNCLKTKLGCPQNIKINWNNG